MLRELTIEEKDATLKGVTEGTAQIATALITVQRHDLMQRLLDLSAETLEALGVESNYSVKDIMEGLDKASKPTMQEWLNSLVQQHAHTDFNGYKCDKCGDKAFNGQRDVEGSFRKWMENHYEGDCTYRVEYV